jgi:hypothetical protein
MSAFKIPGDFLDRDNYQVTKINQSIIDNLPSIGSVSFANFFNITVLKPPITFYRISISPSDYMRILLPIASKKDREIQKFGMSRPESWDLQPFLAISRHNLKRDKVFVKETFQICKYV